ncbi:MAG: type III-A CRISPR-associated RAMP protein Csm5 [Leptolyngbyaceae cyanobacterium RM1_406_9]|nr:type III-A CRISPR-associated RAMP protein Csm5 [Leptolyngbyaceae cyanobacterium RM1_406_9]
MLSSTSLTKPQTLDSCKIQLISPMLHIGSEVSKLSPFEYVATSKFVYQPNAEALARSLYKQGRLPDYLYAIAQRETILPILEQAFGETWWQAQDTNGQPIFPKVTRSLRWTDQPIVDLRPMIRNGLGQLYIPGSSIKGAIRTAIAYHLLLKSETFHVPPEARMSEIEKTLRAKIKTHDHKEKQKYGGSDKPQKKLEKPFSEYNKKHIDDLFMKHLFHSFDIYDINSGQKALGKAEDANRDFMRAIRVTDSKPLIYEPRQSDSNCPIVAEVIVVSHDQHWRAKYRTPVYVELATNVLTEFTLTLDQKMLKQFRHKSEMQIPFKNIDELLEICSDFAQAQWECELDYWEMIQNNPNAQYKHETINLDFGELRDTFYNVESCPYNLRVGWASGLPGTTIHLGFEDDDLTTNLRDRCHPRNSAPGFEAPKSRRVVANRDREITSALGWVKFKPL